MVAAERENLPDLSHVTVIVPTLYSVAPLTRALVAAAQCSALALPAFVTWPMFAERQAPAATSTPDSRRATLLYQALKSKPWFEEGDLWDLVRELLELFDELTLNTVSLGTETDFAERLARAYRAKTSLPLQFEARLVHELWFAMHETGDAASTYASQLAAAARHPKGPLYVVAPRALRTVERDFLIAYARHAEVHIILPTRALDETPIARMLDAAWSAVGDASPSLRERAAQARELGENPLKPRVQLLPASSLEHEARSAEAVILQALARGEEHILVVVLDRLVARRVRALLERSHVLVADETGWAFSTTSASTLIVRWLDCIANDFHYESVMDVLKSPFIDLGNDSNTSIFLFESAIRSHGLTRNLQLYRQAVDAAALPLLERLSAAQQPFEVKSQTLSQWLNALFTALDVLGASEALRGDAAGVQILSALHQLSHELREDTGLYPFHSWRAWLTRQLEQRTFRDADVESPVIFTHLATARLRDVDSAIIIGADAAHLPQRRAGSGFFNEAVRAELGLPLYEETIRAMEDDLFDLCTRAKQTWFSWQAQKNDDANLMSPWLERLSALHETAFGSPLIDADTLERAARRPAPRNEVIPSRRPAPALSPAQLPTRISASAYNTLLACPYQFFASYVLRLRRIEDIDAPVEKRDYGNFVHQILYDFHTAVPLVSALNQQTAGELLEQVSDKVFAAAVAQDPLVLGWLAKWKAQIPAYLDWQRDREQAGWRLSETETAKSRTLALDEATTITLEGRIDRIERDATGAISIGDYKTKAYAKLKRTFDAPGEDVQLSFYHALFDEPVDEVQFISIDKTVKAIIQPELDRQAPAAMERLRSLLLDMRKGAPLPAHGVTEICTYCEVRLMCRKDHWNE